VARTTSNAPSEGETIQSLREMLRLFIDWSAEVPDSYFRSNPGARKAYQEDLSRAKRLLDASRDG
jgi:hypothetical protein